MQKKGYLKILFGFLIIVLFLIFTTPLFIEPWLGKKIASELSEKIKNSIVAIEKVHISIFSAGIELNTITITSKPDSITTGNLNIKIDSVKIRGIHFAGILFKNQFDIREITVSGSSITGELWFPKNEAKPIISQSEIRIENIVVDHLELAVTNGLSAKAYSVKEGYLKLVGIHIEKLDTISVDNIRQINLKADQIVIVSADSMYSYKAAGIRYSASTLLVNSFYIQPNFSIGDFEAKHKFQTDRIKANFSTINVHDFSAAAFVKSGSLISSGIEIGEMNMDVFRDLRKKFHHKIKPPFQEMITNYPGVLTIDSITLYNGNITYTEHVEKASEAGTISFGHVKAKIYNITNDTTYLTQKGYLTLNAQGLLMGKGNLNINLKGRIFDLQNTFSVNGTLGGMDVKELNPLLEKNVFIYATSGKIKAMNFNFIANNKKARGTLNLLYHGLDIAVKNKRTNDTTALKERIISFIINTKVLDANPIPHEAARIGIIDYTRDPERFILNYCFKSILTGIKSSLVKSPEKKSK
jgi:hypothetical protein